MSKLNIITNNKDDFKNLLRKHNPIKYLSESQDLCIHLTDWHGVDSTEMQDHLLGKLLAPEGERWERPGGQEYSEQDWEPEGDANSEDEQDSEEEAIQRYGSEFLVYAFGLTQEGDSVTLRISDFKPYFYIKVPEDWRSVHVEILIEYLREKVWPNRSKYALINYELIKSKPYYGFTAEDQFQFLQMTFQDYAGFRKWSWLFKKPIKIVGLNANRAHRYSLYESNINPMIRLMHIKELSPSGWIRVPANRFQIVRSELLRETQTQLEVRVSYQDLQPLHERSQIPGIIIAAYDIEADSSHGDFPVAKKDYEKLARDIITEYVRLSGEQDQSLLKEPRALLNSWLNLSFQDMYQNYNLNRIVTDQPISSKELLERIDPILQRVFGICQRYAETVTSMDKSSRDNSTCTQTSHTETPNRLVQELHSLFEHNLPLIDLESIQSSHYALLALQICKEYHDNLQRKTIYVLQRPLEWLRYLLQLAFHPYFDSHNISRVYTKKNRKPEAERIVDLVPEVHSICQECYQFLHQKQLDRKSQMTAEQKKVEKARRYRLAVQEGRLDEEGNPIELTQDKFVERLKILLNAHLPSVEGDITIQIGTTYQRYGERHPFLKHIIVLDSCLPISREQLIADEHKDITFPDRELLSHLGRIYPKLMGPRLVEVSTEQKLSEVTSEGLISVEESDGSYLDSPGAQLLRSLGAKPNLKTLSATERRQLNQLVLDHNREEQLREDTSLVVVESYPTERQVLLAWTRLIRESDPDLLTGYNVFGFDFHFLAQRSQELRIFSEFTELGRFRKLPQGFKEQNLSSSGLGDNILRYIPMFGRVVTDLYKVVQAGHKLPMYGLNYVSKHFLYMSKNDLPPSQIFVMQKGTAADRRVIAEYCLVDCVLCNRLLNRLEIVTNNIGMSNVCMVPLSYLFLRGQGVKIQSLVSMECRKNGFLMPVLERNQGDDDGYEGAIVLKPENDIYFEPVVVCDFNSLYPSCIISENISHDSYVESGSKYDNLPGYEYVDIEYDLYREEPIPGRKKTQKVPAGVRTCRFAQPPNGQKSLLPRILQRLLQARKDTRKAQKAFQKGDFQWKVKEGLQLAYKITANSLYGQLGARTSAIYFKDGAASTTATGRKLIHFTKDFFESKYPGAKAVYGDTDSVFIKFDCRDAEGQKLYGLDAINRSISLCIEGSLAISRQLKPPHNLEFEKAILPFILITKKRYHGHYYTQYGSPSYYVNSMGIVLKRRDNAPIVKRIFGEVVDIIMKEHDVPKAIAQARSLARDLLEGKFPLEEFIITKTLKSYYKLPQQIAHNVLAQRIGKRDPGNKPRANDRIAYAYIPIPKGQEKGILQGERIETPEYICEHDLQIDYKFYLTNQIMKPVCQIFDLVTDDLANIFDEPIRDYDYKRAGIRKITDWFTVKKLDKSQYSNLHPGSQNKDGNPEAEDDESESGEEDDED